MNKKLFLLGMAGIFLFVLASGFASAYYYNSCRYGDCNYGGNYYDRYSYHSMRSYGNYGMPSYSKSVDYNKVQSSRYIGYGGWETRTTYTKTVREYPGYGGYYGGYNYYPKYYSYGW